MVSLINKYDNDAGYIDFKVRVRVNWWNQFLILSKQEFCFIMQDVTKEKNIYSIHYKGFDQYMGD